MGKNNLPDGIEMTFAEIGKEIGLSRMGAQHVYKQAIKKLQKDNRLREFAEVVKEKKS
jgi:DNA-directed RNA polymerase sigma subunit (sigma70/sigma32)